MQLREKLNGDKRVAVGLVAVVGLVALVFIVSQLRGTKEVAQSVSRQAYFTTDDGLSWFADGASKQPPFDHEGKSANRVFVYRGADGKPFAAYLLRYTDAARKQLASDPQVLAKLRDTAYEVKKPKDSGSWVPRNSAAGAKIMSVLQADGKTPADPVEP